MSIFQIKAKFLVISLLALSTCLPGRAWADTCTLIVSFPETEIIHEDGDCATRRSPQSTFKIPLALVGYDDGYLTGENDPKLPYKQTYAASREEERHAAGPSRWLKDSVVWYSQELTRHLGHEKLQRYVDLFNYGNRDLSGDAGKHNGLTNAWLSSSLKISPAEQVGFIRAMLLRELTIDDHAYDMTKTIMPHFKSGTIDVFGKTGSGFKRTANGSLDRAAQEGWFVGWAEDADRKYVFATFLADENVAGYAGPRARDLLLKKFPELIARDRRNEF